MQLINTQTGQPEEIPDDHLIEAGRTGLYGLPADQGPIDATSPDGSRVQIDPRHLFDALVAGYRVGQASEVSETEKGFRDRPISAAALGAARGLTMGLSDQLLSRTGLVEQETLEGIERQNRTASVLGEAASFFAPLGAPKLIKGAGEAAEVAAVAGLKKKGGNVLAEELAKVAENEAAESAVKEALGKVTPAAVDITEAATAKEAAQQVAEAAAKATPEVVPTAAKAAEQADVLKKASAELDRIKVEREAAKKILNAGKDDAAKNAARATLKDLNAQEDAIRATMTEASRTAVEGEIVATAEQAQAIKAAENRLAKVQEEIAKAKTFQARAAKDEVERAAKKAAGIEVEEVPSVFGAATGEKMAGHLAELATKEKKALEALEAAKAAPKIAAQQATQAAKKGSNITQELIDAARKAEELENKVTKAIVNTANAKNGTEIKAVRKAEEMVLKQRAIEARKALKELIKRSGTEDRARAAEAVGAELFDQTRVARIPEGVLKATKALEDIESKLDAAKTLTSTAKGEARMYARAEQAILEQQKAAAKKTLREAAEEASEAAIERRMQKEAAEKAMRDRLAGEPNLAARVLSNALGRAARGGTEGALLGLGHGISQQALDPEYSGENLLTDIGLGALVGAATGGGAGALEASARPLASKALIAGAVAHQAYHSPSWTIRRMLLGRWNVLTNEAMRADIIRRLDDVIVGNESRLARGIKGFLSKTVEALPPTTTIMALGTQGHAHDPLASYDSAARTVQGAAADPGSLHLGLARALAHPEMPGPSLGAQLGVQRTIQFLNERLPRDPRSGLGLGLRRSAWRASDAERRDFMLQVESLRDPVGTLEDPSSIRPIQMRALEANYPRLVEAFRDRLRRQLVDGAYDLDYQQRMQIQVLLGQPTDELGGPMGNAVQQTFVVPETEEHGSGDPMGTSDSSGMRGEARREQAGTTWQQLY